MIAGEWRLIARGFLVAALGSAALMFFIVAISAGYVGRFAVAGVTMLFACCLAIAFHGCIFHFLETLESRERAISAEFDSQLSEQMPSDAVDD